MAEKNIMHIDIVIPFETKRRLGESMNKTMERLDEGDWCIFLDSDALMLTMHELWYSACIDVIHKIGYEAGFVSCVTNRIGNQWQMAENPIDNDDIKCHFKFAHELWKKYGTEYITPSHGQLLSGVFIMTHKRAWMDAGRFNDGWKVDNWYDKAIVKAGYKRVIMQGVYCYHIYKKKNEWMEELTK